MSLKERIIAATLSILVFAVLFGLVHHCMVESQVKTRQVYAERLAHIQQISKTSPDELPTEVRDMLYKLCMVVFPSSQAAALPYVREAMYLLEDYYNEKGTPEKYIELIEHFNAEDYFKPREVTSWTI